MHRIDEKLKSMDAKLGTSQVPKMVKGYHEAIDVWHPIIPSQNSVAKPPALAPNLVGSLWNLSPGR